MKKVFSLALVAMFVFTGVANAAPKVLRKDSYETIAASQTDQVLGGTGAQGDVLKRLIIVPTTTGAGAVDIQDGAGTEINVFKGGGTLSDLKTYVVEINAKSAAGAWSVTTGANVSVVAVGDFTI
jgi:hypothetical protein